MVEHVCLIGLDEPESDAIRAMIDGPVVAHVVLPGMMVKDRQLWVEGERGPRIGIMSWIGLTDTKQTEAMRI